MQTQRIIRMGRKRIIKDPPKQVNLTKSQIQRAVEAVVYGPAKDTHYVIRGD